LLSDGLNILCHRLIAYIRELRLADTLELHGFYH
jgi:hypothetical protein